jgi:hypothetical protein
LLGMRSFLRKSFSQKKLVGAQCDPKRFEKHKKMFQFSLMRRCSKMSRWSSLTNMVTPQVLVTGYIVRLDLIKICQVMTRWDVNSSNVYLSQNFVDMLTFSKYAWVVLIMSFHVDHLIMNISWAYERLHVDLDQKLHEMIVSTLLKNTFVNWVGICDVN